MSTGQELAGKTSREWLKEIATAIGNGSTEERAVRLLEWLGDHLTMTTIHSGLTRPRDVLNEGTAWCDQYSRAFLWVARELLDVPGRFVWLSHSDGESGHIVPEIEYSEAWHLFGVAHRTVYRDPADGHVPSHAELLLNPSIVEAVNDPWIGLNGEGMVGFYRGPATFHEYEGEPVDCREELLEKIDQRKALVGVVGLGYVGLPLAVEFAQAGFTVVGCDVDVGKVEAVRNGRSYVDDVSSSVLSDLVKLARIGATTNFDDLVQLDAISICVPTPLRKTKDPDLSFVTDAVAQIAARLKPGALVTLESTTYPGTTEELVLPALSTSGCQVGEDFFLAFSPERIDPGNRVHRTRNTPKVIGGVTPACREVAAALYGAAVERVVTVSSPRAAEMVKLLENTFRAVNIALANEIALICEKLGVDVWEVIDAAATKPFGFMPFYPGPGLGGHCIPLDPHYLAWKLRALEYNARFIQLADEINSDMPHKVVVNVAHALNSIRKPIAGSRILVLGVAYKANVSDVRESPALDIIRHLLEGGAEIRYHDPHVPEIEVAGQRIVAIDLGSDAVAQADCVVIVTDHARIDWAMVARESRLVVDTRNALRRLA